MKPGSTFQTYLADELVKRCRANPAYSLRSFARKLDIEPSALSKILHGKRAVSRRTFDKLAEKLSLDPETARRLAPPAKLRRKRGAAGSPVLAPLLSYAELDAETFKVIADWYHFAILELTTVAGFEGEPRWIARRLGITVSEANIAVARLRKLGLLATGADGRWIDRSSSLSIYRPGVTNRAFRKMQKQILEASLRSLEEDPIERREHSSMTMAVSASKLAEAKERIKRFRRELCDFLQSDGPPRDAVYQLSISLFPATRT